MKHADGAITPVAGKQLLYIDAHRFLGCAFFLPKSCTNENNVCKSLIIMLFLFVSGGVFFILLGIDICGKIHSVQYP